MTKFNFGLPGNTAVNEMINRGTVAVEEAQYMALLALAFEQRTANLIQYAAHNTDALAEGVDVEIRERLGMNPDHPAPAQLVHPDRRCGQPLMDGRNEIRCWAPENHEGNCT